MQVIFRTQTGEIGKEPLKTLAGYRRREVNYAGGVVFGTYMMPSGGGVLRVGMHADALFE